MTSGDFLSVLREARARTIDGAFEVFLDREINISKAIRGRASTSQNHIREFLADEHHRDDTFPRVLTTEDWDFISGSFARHTKNKPLDDIDIMMPLDGHGLVYHQGGWVQPYTVLSDGALVSNPLLADPNRWMDGSCISSRKLIDGFAKVLGRHYHASKVRRVGEAVNVRLALGAGEESDGLGFDIVPCFSLRPNDSTGEHIYLIPDGDNGWIRTNPRLDKDLSDHLNRNNARALRKGVKLVKWWAAQNMGGRMLSYYIELAVMMSFWTYNQGGGTVTSISEATARAFKAVHAAAQIGDQHPLVTGAPMVKRGDVTVNDLARLERATGRARLARQYETAGRREDALKTWVLIFGDSFPTD